MKFKFKLGKFSFQLGTKGPAAARVAAAGEGAQPSAGSQRSEAPTVRRSSPEIQAWLRGGENKASEANAALVSPFQQSVWVYTVVSALAQTVSAIPFRISRGDRSGETLVTKGPVIDLFNRPHEHLNRFRFWEFIVTWYCLRGEIFIVALDKSGSVLPIRHLASIGNSSESSI